MSSQINLISLVLLIIYFTIVQSQPICGNNGNYTRNSPYETNLNTIFSSLPTNIDDYGFNASSAGQSPDRVNALALCRGDVQPDSCRSCVRNATSEIADTCPNQTEAFLWRDDCMLRYSNESVLGTVATSPAYYYWNSNNATSPTEFMLDLRTLLDSIRGQASSGGSSIKVGYGNRSTAGFQTIFALVQCTPDLSGQGCASCLVDAATRLPTCCNNKIGGRVLMPSCNLHYETRPFYNETRLQELTSPPPVTSPPVPSPVTPPPPPVSSTAPPGNDDNNRTQTIIIVVVAVVGVCVILAILVGCLFRKRIKQKPKEEVDTDEISFVESLQYDFGKIRVATNDFSEANKLGQGGFGSVYKGQLQDGQEIAVKRLSKDSGQGDIEFKNEVMLLARLQHRNLVRLMGFSLEENEKVLVYEFVQNASLDNFIFDATKRLLLDWDRRYKIIGGIARGILYLHEDSRLRIIHRDLKAGNVLLDGDMNPKIADFGMARLFVPDETQAMTNRIVGTYGYMAPEYALHGQFSVKSDVFSFGVLVLEIISGQKNSCFLYGENMEDLLSSAWENWREETVANLIDPVLIRSGSGIPRDILRCIHIGLLCIQENVANRPTMASVVLMLNSFSMTLPIPSEPSFFMPNAYDSEASLLQESKSKESNPHESKKNETTSSDLSSQNEASATDLYPR